jgi:uncharacterized protein YxjI
MDASDQKTQLGGCGAGASFARYRLPMNAAALADAVLIKSDCGETAFAIDGGASATADVVRVRELSGAHACLIPGNAVRTGDSVAISGADAALLATVTRLELSPVRDSFSVWVEPATTWAVDGHLAKYEYRIHGATGEIAEVSRRWFRAPNCYGVQVSSGHPELLVLAVAVCLDLIMHEGS